jgi:outer membrane protein OmpA-like peptidoglycan-associated protein
LTTVQVRVLSQTWVAYLESAGARVVEVTTPRSGEGPDTGFTTTLVAPGEYEQIDVRRTDTTVEADLPADLLFDSGSAVLRDDAATRSALTEAARFLAANPGPVTITGHTDTIGSTEANELLGQQRGAVIRDWLVEQEGVDPSRLTVRSAGETEPLIPDATEPEQHQQNRRVTITVLTPAG